MKSKKNVIYLYLIICLVLSIYNVMKVYPFIPLADGLTRWQMAQNIYNTGKIETEGLLSPIIPYMQYATYAFTQNYAVYTFFETILFYICIGILCNICLKNEEIHIKSFTIPLWFIASFILLLLPTISVFPTMITDSALVFDIIILMIWLYKSNLNQYLIAILEIILIFLCVGIRINSLILFCFLILISLFHIIRNNERLKNFITIGILVLGCLLGVIVPSKLVPKSANASTLGMVWELVGIAKNTGDENLISELYKYGDVKEALARYGNPYLNAIVWDSNPPFPALSISREYSSEITKLYVKTAVRIPLSFINVKGEFMMNSLGIKNPLISSARGINSVSPAQKYGALDTKTQTKMRSEFINCTDVIGLRPYLLMIISIFLCFILKKMGEKSHIKIVLIAIIYYSSFLINTQAFEFRYYAPTFYILLIVSVCCIFNIIYKIFEKVSFKKLPFVENKQKE